MVATIDLLLAVSTAFVGDRLLCDAALVKPQGMINIEYEIEASTATTGEF